MSTPSLQHRIFHARAAAGWLLVAALVAGGSLRGALADGTAPAPDRALIEYLERRFDEGLYQEVYDRCRRALAELDRGGGGASSLEADLLHLLTSALIDLGRPRDAEAGEAAGRALEIRTGICGPACVDVARSEALLSRLASAQGDFESAEAHARRSVEIAGGLEESHWKVRAESFERLAYVLWEMARHDQARELYERALAIHQERTPEGTLGMTWSLDGLGRILTETGRMQEALGHFERSLGIREHLLPADHPLIARSLNALAVVHRRLGDNKKAMALYERTLAMNESRLGPDHPHTAMALSNLANTRWDEGDLEGARRLHERALRIRLDKLGGEHPLTGMSYLKLGGALFEMGDYAAASEHYRKASDILTKARGPEHPDVGASLATLGAILREMGDLQGAKSALEQALEIYMKAYGERSDKVAEGLARLADVCLQLDRLPEAEAALKRALEIQTSLGGTKSTLRAALMKLLGLVMLEQGRLEEARSLTGGAVAILEETLGPSAQELGFAYMYLSRAHAGLGNLAEAERLQRKAASIFDASGGMHVGEVEARALLARTLLMQGRREAAVDVAVESESIRRGVFRALAPILTEGRALMHERLRRSGVDVALGALLSGGGAEPLRGARVQAAFDSVIRSRALVLAETAERSRFLRLRSRPETAELAEDLRRATLRLSKLVFSGSADPGAAPGIGTIQEARLGKERAELALARQSERSGGSPSRDEIGLAEVAAALPERASLVAYVRFSRLQKAPQYAPAARDGTAASAAPKWIDVPHYAAFVLPAGSSEPLLVPLGPAAGIEAAVASWRRAVSGPPVDLAGPDAPVVREYTDAGGALRTAIWDRVEKHAGAPGMVLTIPDGPIGLVSFSALPRGDGTYLVEREPVFHYLAAERAVVVNDPHGSRGEGLVAVGGPDYDGRLDAVDERAVTLAARSTPASEAGATRTPVYRSARSACDDPRALRFTPLPASGAEIESIAKIWADSSAVDRAAPGEPALSLTGLQASERAFKQLAPGRKVIHLATHGFFLGRDCRAPGEAPGSFGFANPMLLSGLAFAGANHRAEVDPASEQEDGILTAEEISALDLGGVDWAVLSACDTGVGEVQAGEGVLGLRRAFSTAGARTLIMSLWAVDDAATLDWMKRLYGHRLAGLATPESVRRASLESLRERRERGWSTHPFFWGGFIAAGDWR